ncbi:MAG: 3-deoxy-7-phosphoheptulonate synthase [Spirochaetes bacterium RBG_16_49_21]|nr:MAG: 3-deoxy-7-phosphoheptulonate synthase [Spirochaetes bacterium RBG_16_49_21]
MNLTYIRKYPSLGDILESQPLAADLQEIKNKRDVEIRNILSGADQRLVVLIGPCSAHHAEAVYEYATRLSRLQEQVQDKMVLVPRIYTNKPRTTGKGYKGMLHQPNHRDKPDMSKGLQAIREMHITALSLSHLPAADEMLYPGNYPYLADLLSYVAIGARSVENQEHRLTVSGLDVPVGMKNPTSGDLRVMIDSIYAAQSSHVFVYNGWEVETSGNPLAHGVLRGAMDRYGNHFPNYHYEDLILLAEMYLKRSLQNPSIIVDTNHSNSGKKFGEQPRIVMEVMRSLKHSDILRKLVKGFMIESFLLEGAQDPSGEEFGKSITDPCLGWEDSEKLILELAEFL